VFSLLKNYPGTQPLILISHQPAANNNYYIAGILVSKRRDGCGWWSYFQITSQAVLL